MGKYSYKKYDYEFLPCCKKNICNMLSGRHSIFENSSTESEFVALLSEQMARQIDREILERLRNYQDGWNITIDTTSTTTQI